MTNLLSPRAHGMLDYSTIAATAAAPKLFGFPRKAAIAAYALAGGYLALSALTKYPTAMKQVVPLRAHKITDIALGGVLPALPWMLGFSKSRSARNFFLALTGITAAVTALTDWQQPQRFQEAVPGVRS